MARKGALATLVLLLLQPMAIGYGMQGQSSELDEEPDSRWYTDSDGDGVDDESDACPNGETGWTSGSGNDADGDGCLDSAEDDYVSPCDAGEWGETSDDCAEADPGYYVPIGGSAEQQLCANGTYQPSSGQTSCIEASPGHYVPTPVTWDETVTSFGTTITTGNYHSCGIVESGDAYCWGDQSDGRLGNGQDSGNQNSPQLVSLPTGRTAKSISAGGDHTCAILDNQSVVCWGYNQNTQLGNNNDWSEYSSEPVYVIHQDGSVMTAASLSLGETHSCAVTEEGSAYCWGDDSGGQLGDGGMEGCACWQAVPVEVFASDVKSISAGYSHTCSVMENGSAYCWGNDNYGQLGDGSSGSGGSSEQTSPVEVSLPSGFTAESIDSGSGHTCALLNDGSWLYPYCWGDNEYGQLGDDSTTDRDEPVAVDGAAYGGGTVWNAVVAAGSHSCAMYNGSTSNGELLCWGEGDEGRLGTGSDSNSQTPEGVQFSSWTPIHTLGPVSGRTTCVGLENANVYCWGYGGSGNIGNSDSQNHNSPTYVPCPQISQTDCDPWAVPVTSEVTLTAAPTEQFPCSSGYYQNQSGQVSCIPCPPGTYNPDTGSSASSDCLEADAGHYAETTYWNETVSNGLGDTLSMGDGYACAIVEDGSIWCWGEAQDVGSVAEEPTQVSIPSSRTAKSISAGVEHACTILDNGSAMCWGEGDDWRLGFGNEQDQGSPVYVHDPFDGSTPWEVNEWSSISAGDRSSCGVLVDGTAWCWGANDEGQLGWDDSEAPSNGYSSPHLVGLPSEGQGNVSSISVGSTHACALLENGSVYCWGDNNFGQLGDGTTADDGFVGTPVQVSLPSGRTAVSISAGKWVSCAIMDNGSAMCWGWNEAGAVGCDEDFSDSDDCEASLSGETNPDPLWVDFDGQDITIVDIEAGYYHTCAATDEGKAFCWGYGFSSREEIVDQAETVEFVVASKQQWSTSSCALHGNGSAMCWGYNNLGQLGGGADSGMSCTAGTCNGPIAADQSSIAIPLNYQVQYSTPSSAQTSCPSGTYQPNSGQTSCLDADPGNYTISVDEIEWTFTCPPAEMGMSEDWDSGYSVSVYDNDSGAYLGGCTQLSDSDEDGNGDPASNFTVNTAVIDVYCQGAGANPQQPSGDIQASFSGIITVEIEVDSDSNIYCTDEMNADYLETLNASEYLGTTQTECSPGTYQPSSGQDSCLDADPGYYVDGDGSTTQTECSAGTYQPSSGQDSCLDADPGYYVEWDGSTTQTPCSDGTYQPGTGQDECFDADPGHYVDSSGSANQTACSSGTYQPDYAQSSCLDADPGHYVDSNGSTSQTPCSSGTYQPDYAQSSCLDADPGHYVDSSGSDGQITCPPREFQSQSGQDGCSETDIGFFADGFGSDSQTQCPEFTSTISTGSNSSDCILDTDGDLIPNEIDDDDDDDGIDDALDAFSLDATEWDDSDGDGQGDNTDGDVDGDGVANELDALPFNSGETSDNDGDGMGDNEDSDDDNDGVLDSVDSCQFTWGNSTFDRYGCPDTDGDGWSNPDDGWFIQQGADALPEEGTQWVDLDGDGFGDNPLGSEYDACSTLVGNSFVGSFGCPDSDGDGVRDSDDKFPDDPSKWYDSDDDGMADEADSCPGTIVGDEIDESGCSAAQRDSDEDGLKDDVDPCLGSSSNLCLNALTGSDGKERTFGAILAWVVVPSIIAIGSYLALRKKPEEGEFDRIGRSSDPEHVGEGMIDTARFSTVRKLRAEGGMAEVYLAKDKVTGEQVIWKQAAPSRVLSTKEANSALENEVEVLERLDHPRIPNYIDSGFTINEEGDRVLVLIMENIEGGSLDDEMKLLVKMGARQPLEKIIRIVIECCDALDYMADLDPPLYHRDIKPHNIMIEQERGAILIDFGLAKEVAAGSSKSLSAGGHTAGWSPPERERAETGPTTDVYSLGQILWHMLTNESAGIFSEERKSERIIECGHPEWLVDVVNAATIPDKPSKRIGSVAELRYMLENEGEMP